MAAAPGVRRGPTRAEVEQLAQGISSDRPLPILYLSLLESDGNLRYAVASLLRTRPNGFMFAAPDTESVREVLEATADEEGEALAIYYQTEAMGETARGRALGPIHIILADVPWLCLDGFAKTSVLRTAQERSARLTSFSYNGAAARLNSADALDASERWIQENMEEGTAQEYTTAEEAPAEESVEPAGAPEDGEPLSPAELRDLRAQLSSRPSAAAAGGAGLFQQANGLSSAEWAQLRNLAGDPPRRTAAVERTVPGQSSTATALGLFQETELEATAPMLGTEAGNEPAASSLGALLLAQMKQNALLLEKLGGPKPTDSIHAVLGQGSGSGSESGGGVRGHLAREAFMKIMSDLPKVASAARSNALMELGLQRAEPGLMREFLERRVPLSSHRLLGHVGMLAASGWEVAARNNNEELAGFCAQLMIFVEQAALDNGRLQLAYLLTGRADPSPQLWQNARIPGLKPFSRLAAPQWVAANLAYLKELDYAETRIAQLAKGRSTSTAAKTEGDEELEEKPKPKYRPRKPRRPPPGDSAS